MIRNPAKTATHSMLKRLWEGHEKGNWILSDEDMRARLREVDGRIKEFYREKCARREKYLGELAAQYDEAKNKDMSKCVKEIKRKERMKIDYARLRQATGKQNKQATPEVEVPEGVKDVSEMWNIIKGGGTLPERWEKICGRQEVESVVLPWCEAHFHQASETPFAEGVWRKKLDILSNDGIQEALEKGDLCETNEERVEIKQWIEELRVKEGVQGEVKLETTFEDFRKFARRAVESKASSPSRRHYGHYKVLEKREKLLWLVYDVLAIALEYGIVLERWRVLYQVLLQKDPPGKKVHRFRNIIVIEADLMFLMKDIW